MKYCYIINDNVTYFHKGFKTILQVAYLYYKVLKKNCLSPTLGI